MKNIPLLILLMIFVTGHLGAQEESAGKTTVRAAPYYSDPAISPDGSEIAFVSGGDIWTVASKGGPARLLVAHPDYDSRPLYSPDGQYLAFNSMRTGNGDLYTLNLKTGVLQRITYDDGNEELSSWSEDGSYLYFATTAHDIAAMRDIFRVRSTGGTPMPVSDNRFMNEFFASPSPDGKTIAFDARGVASHQWWRNGHSHLDESEIWLLRDQDKYERVTRGGGKDLWPMWGKDGTSLYFVSDRTGTQNLWVSSAGMAKQLTKFTKGRVVWPSISRNGESIVFEKDFKVWKYDIGSGAAAVVVINLVGSAATPAIEHLRLQNQFRDLALSPDGKKVAFVARGEVFVSSSREGGDAFRVTHTISRESQVVWTANSASLIYASERDGVSQLYQYNFVGDKEVRLTRSSLDDMAPLLSPNGKLLAYVRNGTELHVIDLATKADLVVAKGFLGRPPFASAGSLSWSPDNKWIAYAGIGNKTFRNIFVVPAAGGAEPKAVTFLANTFGGNVNWSANGKYILFSTSQRTEKTFIARVDLVPQTPRFKEEQFQQMFNEQTTSPSMPVTPMVTRVTRDTGKVANDSSLVAGRNPRLAVTPVSIQTDGIRRRLNFLPLDVDVNDYVINKEGTIMVLSASIAGQTNLYTYSLQEDQSGSGRAESAGIRQLTSSPGGKSDAQFSADGKELFYLEQGKIQSVSLESKMPRPLAVTAEMDVDFNQEKVEIFREAWEAQNKSYYNPEFNGVDWKAVKAEYEPLAAGAGTADELRRILNLMVGELNSSHSGVSGPATERPGAASAVGKIGLRFDRKEYENNGRFKIIEVLSLGPVDITGKVKVGDYLLGIDEVTLTGKDNIDQLLENKSGKRVTLTISSTTSPTDARKVAVRPVNVATEKGLLYKQWVEQQREYVDKVSNGRLGYVHMADMSEQSLNQLYLDMDADNHSREGVVVDVRNNNGGFVNAYALDVITRKNYMTMTGRGLPSSPARVQLGQRALDAPTILVTNQHSLSDAEDFTEGYRALKIGKVVGEPTGGWIIYTSSAPLIDGSSVRLPFIKVEDHEGKNMEMVPRPVDIFVSRQLGEGNNKDSQLDAAVKELLSELGTRKKASGF